MTKQMGRIWGVVVIAAGLATSLSNDVWAATAELPGEPPQASPLQQGTVTPVAAAPLTWSELETIGYDGAASAVNEWRKASSLSGATVKGPAVTIPAGALQSSVDITKEMDAYFTAKKVKPEIARAFSGAFGAAWNAWAKGYSTVAPVACAGIDLIPLTNITNTPCLGLPPHPMRLGASPGELMLSGPALATAMKALDPTPTSAPHYDLVATKLGLRFQTWIGVALLQNVRVDASRAKTIGPFVGKAYGTNVLGGPSF